MKNDIIKIMNRDFNANPEYLWKKYPTFCVFRHANNQKWFALVAQLPRSVLGLSGDGVVDFINLKSDNVEFFCGVDGILPAYHMNKKNWITVLLDGTVAKQNVKKLIKMSFDLTA